MAIGFVASTFWSFILLASLFSGDEAIELEGILLGVLVLSCVVSFISVFKGRLKAVDLLIGSGLALALFSIITAGRNHWIAVLVSGFPFVLSGILIKYGLREIKDHRGPS